MLLLIISCGMHDAWSVCRIESNLLVKRFTQDLRIHDGMRMAAAARFQVCASRSTDCKCVWYSYSYVPPHIPFSTPYWYTCSRHATMLCARSSRATAWRGRPLRFLTIHKEHAVKQPLRFQTCRCVPCAQVFASIALTSRDACQMYFAVRIRSILVLTLPLMPLLPTSARPMQSAEYPRGCNHLQDP